MLLDMQEHPENYSEQTLETMLKDPEVRELMEATAQLKQAMTWENTGKNTANVDAEWQRFSKTHYTESKPRRGWLKVAATFIRSPQHSLVYSLSQAWLLQLSTSFVTL